MDAGLNQQAVNYGFNRMVAAFVEANLFVERTQVAVDTRANESVAGQLGNLFLEFAFSSAHDGREDHHAFAFGQRQDTLQNLIDALAGNRPAALRTVGLSDRRKQQPQIIVYFGYRSDSRTGTASHSFFLDRDRRR